MRRLFLILLLAVSVGAFGSVASATPFTLGSTLNFTGTGFDVDFNPISEAEFNALALGSAVCLETNPSGDCGTFPSLDTLDVLYFTVTVNSGNVTELMVVTYSDPGPPFLTGVPWEGAGYIPDTGPNPGGVTFGTNPLFDGGGSDVIWASSGQTTDVLWVAYADTDLSTTDNVNFMVKSQGNGSANTPSPVPDLTEIPEPGTVLLLTGGLLGLAVSSRRR